MPHRGKPPSEFEDGRSSTYPRQQSWKVPVFPSARLSYCRALKMTLVLNVFGEGGLVGVVKTTHPGETLEGGVRETGDSSSTRKVVPLRRRDRCRWL